MLRTVTPDRAFNFYRGIDQRHGSASKNLVEFAHGEGDRPTLGSAPPKKGETLRLGSGC